MQQHGRDRDEITGRRDDMTSDPGSTARRAPGTGTAGGRSGANTESVDFDDMGDLDRGADDRTEAEPSTGPGPGYGIGNAGETGGGVDTGSAYVIRYQEKTGPAMGPASAMRVDNVTGGMGSGVGDADGIGQGTDTDPETLRGETPATGTSQRAGLGGPSSGQQTDLDPGAGVPFANPADMGDQG
jgi:hypothetical protein